MFKVGEIDVSQGHKVVTAAEVSGGTIGAFLGGIVGAGIVIADFQPANGVDGEISARETKINNLVGVQSDARGLAGPHDRAVINRFVQKDIDVYQGQISSLQANRPPTPSLTQGVEIFGGVAFTGAIAVTTLVALSRFAAYHLRKHIYIRQAVDSLGSDITGAHGLIEHPEDLR